MPDKLLIGLLDDNKQLLCEYETFIESAIIENNLRAEIVCVTDRPEEFLEMVVSGRINTCFVDINLGNNNNGINIAQKIRASMGMYSVEIVFITSFAQFMQSAFRIKPFNYLLKPISCNTIKKELLRLSKSFLTNTLPQDDGFLTIQNKYMLKRIKKDEIIYCEYSNFKTTVYGVHDQLQFYIPLHSVKTQLPSESFLHSQRNTIVNIRFVEKIDFSNEGQIYLGNGIGPLPLSRKYKKEWKNHGIGNSI